MSDNINDHIGRATGEQDEEARIQRSNASDRKFLIDAAARRSPIPKIIDQTIEDRYALYHV